MDVSSSDWRFVTRLDAVNARMPFWRVCGLADAFWHLVQNSPRSARRRLFFKSSMLECALVSVCACLRVHAVHDLRSTWLCWYVSQRMCVCACAVVFSLDES